MAKRSPHGARTKKKALPPAEPQVSQGCEFKFLPFSEDDVRELAEGRVPEQVQEAAQGFLALLPKEGDQYLPMPWRDKKAG